MKKGVRRSEHNTTNRSAAAGRGKMREGPSAGQVQVASGRKLTSQPITARITQVTSPGAES